MKKINLNTIKKVKTGKIIFTSFAIMVISVFSINMIGCSNDSNESKELEQISFQKRNGNFENEGISLYEDATGKIFRNPEKFQSIVGKHFRKESEMMITQGFLDDLRGEMGVVFDLPIAELNYIFNDVLRFVGSSNIEEVIEKSDFNVVTKEIITKTLITSGGVDDFSPFEGYDLLSDYDKKFLDLSNAIVGSNPDPGKTTDALWDCSIQGVLVDCWAAGAVGGAIIGGSCCGLPGAAVGAVVGAVVGLVADSK